MSARDGIHQEMRQLLRARRAAKAKLEDTIEQRGELMMNPKVQRIIWASNGALAPPSRVWMGGYVFISDLNDGTVRVRATRGLYRGLTLNYDREAVRLQGVHP